MFVAEHHLVGYYVAVRFNLWLDLISLSGRVLIATLGSDDDQAKYLSTKPCCMPPVLHVHD
jgi:hypothetical protein